MAKDKHIKERLDRSIFRKTKAGTINIYVEDAKQMSYAERLAAGWILSCRVYGLDPMDEHRVDRTIFSVRQHD
ncbi:MAG: hypothetical protein KTR24_01005 [Saprospiraceae bacterium]|nr:hypothetical protein [Saprospiraceae bacterium]